MTSETLPRRYAKSDVTRARIVGRARELFVERGFSAVSLRDIAAAADLSHTALRRHFSSSEQVLDAVVAELERENREWFEQAGLESRSSDALLTLARHNAEVPGYLPLFAALAGEATSARHPAHARMRARYVGVRDSMADALDLDPVGATLLAAMFDGLQIASLYDGSISAPDELEAIIEAGVLRGDSGAPGGPATSASGAGGRGAPSYPAMSAPPVGEGTTGDRILAHALDEFAIAGFHKARLERIAHAAGVSKATILHHFATKSGLLIAVLEQRDRRMLTLHDASGVDAAERISAIAAGVGRLEPDSAMQLAAIVLGEAVAPGHPAHHWFAERLEANRRSLEADIRAARPSARDVEPGRAALWLAAGWDGLQIQLLYGADRRAISAAVARLVATAAL